MHHWLITAQITLTVQLFRGSTVLDINKNYCVIIKCILFVAEGSSIHDRRDRLEKGYLPHDGENADAYGSINLQCDRRREECKVQLYTVEVV